MILMVMLALVIFIEECPQSPRLTDSEWPQSMLTEHGLHQGLDLGMI